MSADGMSVTRLPAETRLAAPWRNGRGITREVAVQPPGATLADFDWRISMAELNGAAPFSRFPGVDRVLTVVAGTLELRFAGRDAVRLGPDSAPLAFAGEDDVIGETVGDAAIDLNVMVRRGFSTATVQRVGAPAVCIRQRINVLLALSQSHAIFDARRFDLARYDALLLHGVDGMLELNGPAVLIGLPPEGA